MKELANRIEKDMVKVWHIVSYLTLAVLLAICVGYTSLMIIFHWWRWPLYVIGVGTLLLFIYDRVIAPTYRYRTFRYEVREDELEMQEGIFTISRTLIPMNRIQYVTTEQGPIMRKYKLMELRVSTAAMTHSIKGITEEKAEELRQVISELVKESEEDV